MSGAPRQPSCTVAAHQGLGGQQVKTKATMCWVAHCAMRIAWIVCSTILHTPQFKRDFECAIVGVCYFVAVGIGAWFWRVGLERWAPRHRELRERAGGVRVCVCVCVRAAAVCQFGLSCRAQVGIEVHRLYVTWLYCELLHNHDINGGTHRVCCTHELARH